MVYKYTFQKYEPEKMSRAVGTDLSISTKNAIEVCNAIRGKKVSQAIQILNDAIALKKAIPFRRFTEGAGHKPGIGPGRYVPKTCKAILNVLNSAVSNAEDKALDKDNLFIIHINAHRASKPLHYGRRRREMKRSHVEIVLTELEEKKKDQPKLKQKKTSKSKNKDNKIQSTNNKLDNEQKEKTKKQEKQNEEDSQ